MQKVYILIVICITWVCFQANAQDPHYSQYLHTPLWINPAKAGQIDSDLRLTANYKDQWSSVTVPYSTATVMADMKIPYYFGKSCSYFGAGILLMNDQAGDGMLRNTTAQLALTYNQSLSSKGKPTYMTLGLMVGGGQKAFNQQKLYFDNQYTGIGFDMNLPTGENFSRTSLLYLDISAGLGLSTALNDISGISLGLAIYHLNRPNVSFLDSDTEILPTRFVASADGKIGFGTNAEFAILPTVVYMMQGKHEEITLGALLKYSMSDEFAISGGAAYRSNDAIIPMVRMDWKSLAIGFSYDANISNLAAASQSIGSMELSLIYTPMVFSEKQQCDVIFCPW